MNPMTLNAWLAFATALIIVGTFNHMSSKTTTAVRLAITIIFAGLLGQWLGVLAKQWDHYADTMIYGGIAALMVASQRTPCGMPAEYLQKVSIAITIGTAFYTGVMWGWA